MKKKKLILRALLLGIISIIIQSCANPMLIEDGNYYEMIEIDGQPYLWDKSIDGGLVKYERDTVK